MRFNILVTVSILFTCALGAVIPANTLSSRDLEARDGFENDAADILIREPKNKPVKYHVKAGGGNPSQTYSRKEVRTAVSAARKEHSRQQSMKAVGTWSKSQQKKTPLQPFSNNNHHTPKKHGPSPNHKVSLPHMKGPGYEYPLPNKNPHAKPGSKGPARVLLQEHKGKLKFKGVVAHDQSRAHGSKGAHDHFKVKPSFNKGKKGKKH
ncbi:hypothetical protein CPB83DRAFT_860929 [Crepidotus variabilis]|uniref:Secreted protein n=1 Tax=Crepidotus variabilis TaxID=179855 RepID=A0A9P6JKT6_9AGAR|nr:hypothetical protein CPB83DRAFT_860929 [Crepidotus variabilis]